MIENSECGATAGKLLINNHGAARQYRICVRAQLQGTRVSATRRSSDADDTFPFVFKMR